MIFGVTLNFAKVIDDNTDKNITFLEKQITSLSIHRMTTMTFSLKTFPINYRLNSIKNRFDATYVASEKYVSCGINLPCFSLASTSRCSVNFFR